MTYIKPHMLESLAGHELVEVPTGEYLRLFEMRRPGTGVYSATLLFGRFGIIIVGDLRIGPTGTPVAYGYGLDWFASSLGEGYLCEKFLGASHFDRAYSRGVRKDSWEADAGWLCALQKRFRELYCGLGTEGEG